MMLRVEMRMGLGKQIGLEMRMGLRKQIEPEIRIEPVMKMGPRIFVCMWKAFHLPATKYEHVYRVSYWHFAHNKFFL